MWRRLVNRVEWLDERIWSVLGRLLVFALPATLILLVFAAVLRAYPHERTFSLYTISDAVSITLTDPLPVVVRLPEALLKTDQGSFQGPYESAQLELNADVTLNLRRVRDGDLLIALDWPASSKGARLTDKSGGRVDIAPGCLFRVALSRPSRPAGGGPERTPESVTIPFGGMVKVGQGAGNLVSGTLTSGRVAITEKQILAEDRYLVSESPLDPGDTPTFLDANKRPVAAVGFVHVGAENAIRLVAHAVADSLVVERFGARDYAVSAHIFDLFQKDPWLYYPSSLAAYLGALIALHQHGEKAHRKRKYHRDSLAKSEAKTVEG